MKLLVFSLLFFLAPVLVFECNVRGEPRTSTASVRVKEDNPDVPQK